MQGLATVCQILVALYPIQFQIYQRAKDKDLFPGYGPQDTVNACTQFVDIPHFIEGTSTEF